MKNLIAFFTVGITDQTFWVVVLTAASAYLMGERSIIENIAPTCFIGLFVWAVTYVLLLQSTAWGYIVSSVLVAMSVFLFIVGGTLLAIVVLIGALVPLIGLGLNFLRDFAMRKAFKNYHVH